MIKLLRQAAKHLVLNTKALQNPSVGYCTNNSLLPNVIVRTDSHRLREMLFLQASPYTTQLNQDVFALLVTRFRRGFFLEIGANDGFTLSNTVYLEEHFGWDGILVEANPSYEDSLRARRAKSVMAAVVGTEGEYTFRSAGLFGGLTGSLDTTHAARTQAAPMISVWGTTLVRILETHDAPSRIDFVSIDVEGAEVPIVEQMCSLTAYRFTCGAIEHNSREADYRAICDTLERAGYRVVWNGQTGHDLFFVDPNAPS